MQTNESSYSNINLHSLRAPRRFFAALGIAAALASFSLTAGAYAQQYDQPGTGAPHQERNPDQHPELFVGSVRHTARGDATSEMIGTGAPHQERNPSAHPELFRTLSPTDKPAVKQVRSHAKARRVLVAVATVGILVNEQSNVDADMTGSDAPHQERNCSQHPELWSR